MARTAQQSIKELVDHCKKGDRQSYTQIYNLFAGQLFSSALRLLNNRHDAEDMVQESFVAAFTHIRQFDPSKAGFSTWLNRILINKCIDKLKKPKFAITGLDQFHETDLHEPAEITITGTDDMVSKIKQAINILPVGYRTILSLSLFEELSYKEIAASLGITESTCRSQYMRAKEKLNALLTQTTAHG